MKNHVHFVSALNGDETESQVRSVSVNASVGAQIWIIQGWGDSVPKHEVKSILEW